MQDYVIRLGQNRLEIDCSRSVFMYRRYVEDALQSESIIMSDSSDDVVVGIFPIPPFQTLMKAAKNVYLKFKSQIVLDQKSEAVLYSKIPIEIGIYRQSKDEELLLDAFSLARQQFALYGPPETGVVCRYKEVEISPKESEIAATKYEEAIVRIRISNMIDNVVKVSRVIIPMEEIVLDHVHDDAWVPGSVEMNLDMAFGKDVVNVQLIGTSSKRGDKTSRLKKGNTDTLAFYMDAGY